MSDLLHPDESREDEVEQAPEDLGEFVLAATADDDIEAELLGRACEEQRIPVILQDPRNGVVGKLSSPVDSFRILVPQSQLARAQEVIRARREALEADPEGAERAALEEEELGGSTD